MSYPDGPDTPGYTNYTGNGTPSLGYFNSYLGTFDGPGNPNTNFNPNIGTYANAGTFTWGGGGNLVATTAAPVTTTNFSEWNWEEIVNNVLGLGLPDRAEVTKPRWTGLQSNSSGDGSHFYIYGVIWGKDDSNDMTSQAGDDTLIYLNPVLQTPGGPWDAFLNDLPNTVWDRSTGSIITKHIWLDPTTFYPPVYALAGVEAMFANSVGTLTTVSSALNTDASQFKGKAGGAFAQIINDLLTQTTYASTTMGLPGGAKSYSMMLADAGSEAIDFLNAIWNSYCAWTLQMASTPLGAILQTMLNHQIVIEQNNKPGMYEANPALDPNDTYYGMLSTNGAWMALENDAKKLWNQAIADTLDYNAMNALQALALSYNNAGRTMQPLRLKAPIQIGAGSATPGPNTYGGGLNSFGNDMNKGFGSVANMIANMDKGLGGGFNGLDKFLPNLGNDLGNGLNNIGKFLPNLGNEFSGGLGGLGNEFASGLNSLGNGLTDRSAVLGSGVGQNLSPAGSFSAAALNPAGYSSLNSPGGYSSLYSPSGQSSLLSPGGQSYLNSYVPGATGTTGGGTTGGQPTGALSQSVTSALPRAVDGADQTQQAIEAALASAPRSGPLHNQLEKALASSKKTQAALRSAERNPSISALDQALADNRNTQTALNRALASGDVPSKVASEIRTALAGTGRTHSALEKALAGGYPDASSLHTAMADNSQTRTALDHALASGQIPKTGALHREVESALADTGRTQSVLGRALSSGTPSSSQLKAALADNDATRAALERALASGHVPRTGPLHAALRNALADTGRTGAAINHALVTSAPGGAALQRAITSDRGLQTALHHAAASGQVPGTGRLHDAIQSALSDGGKVQNALRQAVAGGQLSTAAIHRAITDNQALQGALHRALASGQLPKSGPLHADLTSALGDSQKMSSELHQALASRGIAAEPGASVVSGGTSALTGGLGSGLTAASGRPLVSATATPTASTGLSGGAGGISAGQAATLSGPASGTSTAVRTSSGAFVPATSSTTTTGAGGFPMYEPMAGGMGMGGMGGLSGQGGQERERTTWLAEDEAVWGTEPDVTPQVLGRDALDEDDEASEYSDYPERDASAARRSQARFYGR